MAVGSGPVLAWCTLKLKGSGPPVSCGMTPKGEPFPGNCPRVPHVPRAFLGPQWGWEEWSHPGALGMRKWSWTSSCPGGAACAEGQQKLLE